MSSEEGCILALVACLAPFTQRLFSKNGQLWLRVGVITALGIFDTLSDLYVMMEAAGEKEWFWFWALFTPFLMVQLCFAIGAADKVSDMFGELKQNRTLGRIVGFTLGICGLSQLAVAPLPLLTGDEEAIRTVMLYKAFNSYVESAPQLLLQLARIWVNMAGEEPQDPSNMSILSIALSLGSLTYAGLLGVKSQDTYYDDVFFEVKSRGAALGVQTTMVFSGVVVRNLRYVAFFGAFWGWILLPLSLHLLLLTSIFYLYPRVYKGTRYHDAEHVGEALFLALCNMVVPLPPRFKHSRKHVEGAPLPPRYSTPGLAADVMLGTGYFLAAVLYEPPLHSDKIGGLCRGEEDLRNRCFDIGSIFPFVAISVIYAMSIAVLRFGTRPVVDTEKEQSDRDRNKPLVRREILLLSMCGDDDLKESDRLEERYLGNFRHIPMSHTMAGGSKNSSPQTFFVPAPPLPPSVNFSLRGGSVSRPKSSASVQSAASRTVAYSSSIESVLSKNPTSVLQRFTDSANEAGGPPRRMSSGGSKALLKPPPPPQPFISLKSFNQHLVDSKADHDAGRLGTEDIERALTWLKTPSPSSEREKAAEFQDRAGITKIPSNPSRISSGDSHQNFIAAGLAAPAWSPCALSPLCGVASPSGVPSPAPLLTRRGVASPVQGCPKSFFGGKENVNMMERERSYDEFSVVSNWSATTDNLAMEGAYSPVRSPVAGSRAMLSEAALVQEWSAVAPVPMARFGSGSSDGRTGLMEYLQQTGLSRAEARAAVTGSFSNLESAIEAAEGSESSGSSSPRPSEAGATGHSATGHSATGHSATQQLDNSASFSQNDLRALVTWLSGIDGVEGLAPDTQHSALDTQHSALDSQHLGALGAEGLGGEGAEGPEITVI